MQTVSWQPFLVLTKQNTFMQKHRVDTRNPSSGLNKYLPIIESSAHNAQCVQKSRFSRDRIARDVKQRVRMRLRTTKTGTPRTFSPMKNIQWEGHRRSREAQGGLALPKFLALFVVLRFVLWKAVFQTKYCCSLKDKIFAPQSFCAGYTTGKGTKEFALTLSCMYVAPAICIPWHKIRLYIFAHEKCTMQTHLHIKLSCYLSISSVFGHEKYLFKTH